MICGICCINGKYVEGREKVVRSRQEHDKRCPASDIELGVWVDYFRNLFCRDGGAIPTVEDRTLCQIYMEELDSDFMIQEVGRSPENET